MLEYVRKSKYEMIILSLWVMLLNNYRIIYHTIGVDTEEALLFF